MALQEKGKTQMLEEQQSWEEVTGWIGQLSALLESSDAVELELSTSKWGVRLRKEAGQRNRTTLSGEQTAQRAITPRKPAAEDAHEASTLQPHATIRGTSRVLPVTSPMVGTFQFRNRGAVLRGGARIKKGESLGAIRSLNLLHPLESEMTGTVLQSLVEDGTPVEFGQILFLVEVEEDV